MPVQPLVFQDAGSEIHRRTGCGNLFLPELPRLLPRKVPALFLSDRPGPWDGRRGDVRSCSVPCSRLAPAWRMSTIAREEDQALAGPLRKVQEQPKSLFECKSHARRSE